MAAGTYKVANVADQTREWQSQYGPMVSYTVEFHGHSGPVELSQKPGTAPPEVGQDLEGEIVPASNPQYAPKFKRAPRGGSFSGGGGMSPEREKKIVRQHSAEMALRYAAIQQQRGRLPDDFSLDTLKPIIDWFDRDAGV